VWWISPAIGLDLLVMTRLLGRNLCVDSRDALDDGDDTPGDQIVSLVGVLAFVFFGGLVVLVRVG
jgi:hypothetical protein